MTEKDLDAKIKFLESQEYRDYIKDFNKHEEEQLRNKILGQRIFSSTKPSATTGFAGGSNLNMSYPQSSMPTIPYSKQMDVESDGGLMIVGNEVDVKPHNQANVSMPRFLNKNGIGGNITSQSSNYVQETFMHMN